MLNLYKDNSSLTYPVLSSYERELQNHTNILFSSTDPTNNSVKSNNDLDVLINIAP